MQEPRVLFLARCLEFLLETSVIPKLLIDNSACRYILGRSGCGRVRHLSTRVLWVQQKVEKRELYVGPVASAENVADIGTKKLGVVTMRILMNMLGVFGNEKGELVGQTEIDEKQSKQAIRLLAKKQGLSSVKMIQLILASSLVPATSNALSPDGVEMAMSDEIANVLMQLSYMTEYLDAIFQGLIVLVGMLAVLSLCIGLFCRVVFGGEACDSLIGRAFVLSWDVVICLSSPLMRRWIDIRLQWLRDEHQRLLKLKGRAGIMFVQNRVISLYEPKRALDGLVNGFWDEEDHRPETPEEKRQRYLRSELCEVSEPGYRQLLQLLYTTAVAKAALMMMMMMMMMMAHHLEMFMKIWPQHCVVMLMPGKEHLQEPMKAFMKLKHSMIKRPYSNAMMLSTC